MIRIGDRLQLNARGPILFAEEHGCEAQVRCSWMDPMGQWHMAQFASADLRRLDEDVACDAAHSRDTRWSQMMSRVSSFVAFW